MEGFSHDPLEVALSQPLEGELKKRIGMDELEHVAPYLLRLLVEFLRQDRVYAIRDEDGQAVSSVSEMLAYGDITRKAQSFGQERETHRHIGDFLLFWTGMFPEALPSLTKGHVEDSFLDCTLQGSESYFVVSTFKHDPYSGEARLFGLLSDNFSRYQETFYALRSHFPGLG